MIPRRWLSAAFIVLVCLSEATAAAGSDELAVDIASLETGSAGDVTAVVSVLDASGRPIIGLTKENFVARIGIEATGQPGPTTPISQVTAAVNSNIGVAVVLAVDVSGSMEGDPLVQARAAARTFVEGLAPTDSTALVTFGDGVTPVIDFTTDRGAIFAGLDSLQGAGNTALYQATSVSSYVAASAQTQRKAVILLSDGVDFGDRSAVSREASLQQAAAIGAPFFTIGLGSDIDRAYLETLAQTTGGRFLETPTPQGLSELYDAIGDFLRSQYVITLSAGSVDRTQPLTLEIEAMAGSASGLASETLPAVPAPPLSEPSMIMVQGLASGATIDSPVTLSLQVAGGPTPSALRVTVDGSTLAELASPPYEVNLDPAAYAAGSHVLRVEAVDVTLGVAPIELTFMAASPSSGGPSSALLAMGVILLLLAAAGALGLMALIRRQPAATPEVASRVLPWSPRRNGQPEIQESHPSEAPPLSDDALGRLVMTSGPRQGESLEIGARPRRLGASPSCDLVLASEDGSIAPQEARVWVSEGRLMYHKLARLVTFATDSPPGGWFVLQPGEEIQVGPYKLTFELLAPDSGLEEALAALGQAERPQSSSRKNRRAARRSAQKTAEDEEAPAPESELEPEPAPESEPEPESEPGLESESELVRQPASYDDESSNAEDD
jgi:VWFA-related protein